jgi:AraC-like DNA-binding protein
MAYLTRWRMQLAVSWLRTGEVRVAELPYRLGYGSEAAFSSAFKRVVGGAPGTITAASAEPEPSGAPA